MTLLDEVQGVFQFFSDFFSVLPEACQILIISFFGIVVLIGALRLLHI